MSDDPIVMYTVVRRSLKLSAGKVGGQCQHAMDYLAQEFEKLIAMEPIAPDLTWLACVTERLSLFREWRATPDHTKVILGATDEEFEQAKVENPLHFLVVDLGKTQVAPNTETCFALWPMRKSARSPILVKLKPL